MFNLSNTLPTLRNYSPLVCKFLDKVSEFFHACLAAPQGASYLLDLLGFRNRVLSAIGLPIALPLPPAPIHFRKGKG